MPLPKYNKFNAGKTKGYFPINKWRCDTSAHPVIISSDKCASSTPKALFSQQEMQMLVGLSNTLQCDEQNAVRIALYEACKRPMKAHEMMFRYASSQSRDKGHQGRSLAKRWRLPKKEQVAAADAAKVLGITDAEFIRLSIIWLQLGIRKKEIKSVENCKIVSGDQAARQWSRENHGRPPSEQVANLKKSMYQAQQLLDYLDDIREQKHHARQEERSCMPWAMREAIDQQISDYLSTQDDFFDDLLVGESIDDLKIQLELSLVRNYDIDWDTASLIVQDDLLDRRDPKKMTSTEKLELIKQGRKKAADRLRTEKLTYQSKQTEVLEDASRLWRQNYSGDDCVDLDQRSKDNKAAQQVMSQELEQDRKDYLDDPMLWDEDSHKSLQ